MNGAPAGFFQSSRGLKQRDPLSPLLFIFVVEVFSRGLKALYQSNKMQNFLLPRGAPTITHLSYADDFLVFTRATMRSLNNLMQFLLLYERGTGQKVNKLKSGFVISKRCPLGQVRLITARIGIGVVSLPLKYLGVYLYKGRKKSSNFQ